MSAPAPRIEYWPTSEGLHVVRIEADGTVRQVGVLWGVTCDAANAEASAGNVLLQRLQQAPSEVAA